MFKLAIVDLPKEVIAEVQLRTKLWATKNGFAEPECKAKSEKAKKAHTIVNSPDMGDKSPAYAALMSILLDEGITASPKPADIEFAAGIAIVVLGNKNSHNYQVGTTIINRKSTHFDQFARVDGSLGNHMSPSRKDMRPATDAEIEAFFKACDIAEVSKTAVELLSYPVN